MIASASDQLMQSYIDGVLGGDIVVCDAVRGAVERHVRDLERQSTKGFPYHFDPLRAGIVIDFFPMTIKHSIGDYADLPFVLEPWQAFGIGCIFGWLRDDDGARRFRHVYWSMGRKNGKSAMGAGLAIYGASMDINPVTLKPEDVAQVVLSATKKEQSERVIYAEVLRMRRRSKHLETRSTDINRQVFFYHNEGTIFCSGSDKPYDGLNASMAIKDELHAWREVHRDFYNTLQTGSGSRSQPLTITLTTAGDDKSWIWLEEYRAARAVALDEWKDETQFSLIYELDEEDDPLNEDNWIKANPNLGVSVKEDYIRTEANKATRTKLKLNQFTRYHGNRLVSSVEQAFEMEHWDACAGELSDWSDADAFGCGVDLGGRDDFAAWSVVARYIVGERDPETDEEKEEGIPIYLYRYEIEAHVYIAQDTERDLSQAPFAQWIHEGRIKVCKYPIHDMMRDILDSAEELGFWDVAYDPAGGQTMAELMEQEGITPARMPQTYWMFNEPLNDFAQAMSDGRLVQSGCPVLRWCVGNAIACRDRQDRWMLDKKHSIDKIDPVVSTVMAYRRAMVATGRSTDDNLIIV